MLTRFPGPRALALAAVLALPACSDSTGPGSNRGLVAGTYMVIFELAPAVDTPAPLVGRHEFTFRVAAPAESPDDVTLLSSRQVPLEDPAREGYLVLDRDALSIEPRRWQIRFPYAEGDFAVSVTLGETDSGNLVVLTGCFGRAGEFASYLGAGCRLERL